MKANKNHEYASSAGLQKLVPVHFEFSFPKATSICMAGTFNHWQPDGQTSHSSSTGLWWKDMTLPPGTYEYRLVVDGQWMADPATRETAPNPYGGTNSVLRVANSPEAAHLTAAENVPLKSGT